MKKLLLTLFFLAFATCANANNCFWVGGTGTWDNAAITHWAPTTGGGATGCSTSNAAPTTGDTVTFDGASGGGTVTVASTINGLSLNQITMGAFTGTLDFSVNNPNITITAQFSISGSGTRTLKLGSGTFTLSPGGGNNTAWFATTTTGLTFTAGTSTIVYNGTTSVAVNSFAGGGLTYNNVTLANSAAPAVTMQIAGSNTFNSLTVTAPALVKLTGTTTATTLTLAGTSFSNAIALLNDNQPSATTISVASGTVTCNWCAIAGLTFSGGATFTATNSFDLKGNAGITITGPSGGGGHIIGG
jgi:hypothetical protein